MARLLNEQLERLRELVRKAYGAVAGKGGVVPEAGDRTMENLPSAIESMPQTHSSMVVLTATENNKEYLPADYGVDGFSKVTTAVKIENEIQFQFPSEDFFSKITTFGDGNNFDNEVPINASIWNYGNTISFDSLTTVFVKYAMLHITHNGIERVNLPQIKENISTNYGFLFRASANVKHIYLGANGKGNDLKVLFWGNGDRSKIEDIEFEQGFGHSIVINDTNGSSPITRETIVEHMLERLYDFDADPLDGFNPTLSLGTWLSRLTDEDIAIATSKGWTLS